MQFSNKIELSRLLPMFWMHAEVAKHERRVRFVREVCVYFEGKYQTLIFNLYNSVLTYCAPVLKSAIMFIGEFKR